MNEPCQLTFIRITTADNHIIRTFIVAGTITFSRCTPRANRFTCFTGTTFATTMRVVNRIHNDTSYCRTDATPTISTCFADFFQTLLFIAHFADSGSAIYMDFTDFTGAQTNLGISAFFSQYYCRSTGRAGNLRTFARFHFNTVHSSTDGNITNRQSISNFNYSFRTGHQHCADLNAGRRNNVPTLAICITQQSNMSGTVRIIFNPFHFCRNAVFISFEIDNSIMMFMTTAFMAGSNMTIMITAGSRILLLNQCSVRCTFMQTICGYANHAATTSRGRLHFYNSHSIYSLSADAAADSRLSS